MKLRCVKDLRERPMQMCDGPPFSKYWLEPWFLGYPEIDVELNAEIKRKDEESETGVFYRSLYAMIDTRVDFFDPVSNERRPISGFLAVLSVPERTPVILFSVEIVSPDRQVGYVHAVYEEEK
jgi:hypothetical protein